jgi:hypothetical protein
LPISGLARSGRPEQWRNRRDHGCRHLLRERPSAVAGHSRVDIQELLKRFCKAILLA